MNIIYYVKKIKKPICLFVFVLALLLSAKTMKATEIESEPANDIISRYTIHDFCNAETAAYLKYRMFYFETGSSLDSFLNGETCFLTYETSKNTATGRLLVIGSQGDNISSMIKEDMRSFIDLAYYGKDKPTEITFTYINPSDIGVGCFDGYDMVIIEDSVENEAISEETFQYLDSMVKDNKYIIYDSSILNLYYTNNADGVQASFDPETGELIMSVYEVGDFSSKEKAEEYYNKYLKGLHSIEPYDSETYSVALTDVSDIVITPLFDYNHVGKYNFTCFPYLESIIVPERCTEIYGNAFQGCRLLESFDFSNITSVGAYAFSNCNSLVNISFTDKLSVISDHAFECTGRSDIVIPNSIIEMGEGIFYNSSIETLIIEEGVTFVGVSAFAFCGSLKTVEIPESVTSLGEAAFSSAIGMKAVYIKLNEQGLELQKNCFYGCDEACELSIVYGDVEPVRKQLFSPFVDYNYEQNMSNLQTCTADDNTILKYAGDEVKEYTITFDPNGGSILGEQELVVQEGSLYPELPTPVHSDESLTFEGWFTEAGIEIATGTEVDINENCTVKARWFSEETYIVSFYDSFAEEIVKTEEVYNGEEWGDVLPEEEDFQMGEIEGHFEGWHTDTDILINENTLVNLSGDIVLYSKYSSKGANIQYVVRFPEYDKSIKIKTGEAYSKYNLPKPSKQGDTLLGWGTNKRVPKNQIIDLEHATFKYKRNIELYAIWKSEYNAKYTVTNETLTMIPHYYLNSNNTGEIYNPDLERFVSLNWTEFNKEDVKNADWLLNKILKIKAKKNKVIILPVDRILNVNKYKEYGIIKTGWDQETLEKALTLMYCKYFQYLQMIQTPFFKTEKEFYEDPNWKKKLDYNLKVKDFELKEVRDNSSKWCYTVDQDKFRLYYERCSYVEEEVLNICSGFNRRTTVTRAISRINTILTNNYKYDDEEYIYDLYWFFKSKDNRGVCASYSKFAFAILGKCGYEALPCAGYTGSDKIHSINQTVINGKTYYCDFCWDSLEKTTNYLYMNLSEMNSMKCHQNPEPDDCGVIIKITDGRNNPTNIRIKKCRNLKGRKIKLEYSKVYGITGYVIQYGTDETFRNSKTTKILFTKQRKKTISKLKKGKVYYVRVRTYKKVIRNSRITYYGKWSKTKKVRIKK